MNSERKAIYLLWLGLLCSPVYAMNFRLNELLYQINLIGSKTDLFTSFLYQILPLAVLYLIGIRIAFRYGAGKAEGAGSLYIIFGLDHRFGQTVKQRLWTSVFCPLAVSDFWQTCLEDQLVRVPIERGLLALSRRIVALWYFALRHFHHKNQGLTHFLRA